MGMTDPKYRTLVEALKRGILDGKYGIDAPFPSERALIRRSGLSRNTVQHALAELERAGFVSRQQGRGTFVTKRGASRKLGLIVHGSGYCEIFSPIARAISHLCQTHDYTLLFADVGGTDDRARVEQVIRQAREFAWGGVDGVIFQPVELVREAGDVNREIASLFDAAGVPLVLLDSDIVNAPERSGYDLVAVNHFDAGRRLGAHLRGTGAKRIAYLMQADRAPCVQERYLGVRTACEGLALAGQALLAEPDDAAAVRRFLRRYRPDALACYNDRQAVLLMKTLAALGVRVPDDVAVAGFDDVNYAALATPRLTTMHQPCEELAALAFETLLFRMAHPDAPARESFLNAPLVVRESTRPLPAARRKSGWVQRPFSFPREGGVCYPLEG